MPASTPTVSAAPPRVRIQTDDFDVGRELDDLRAGDAGIGALVAFVGTVRDREAGQGGGDDATPPVRALELEHYPGMTEAAIEAMVDEAVRRFGLRAASVVHRVGRLPSSAQIVLVIAAAPHRGTAFQGAEFLIDYLKTQAPFWKKEHTADGRAAWVDARVADDAALARWGIDAGNAAGAPSAAQGPSDSAPAPAAVAQSPAAGTATAPSVAKAPTAAPGLP